VPLSDIERLITAPVIEREILKGDPTMSADAPKYANSTEKSAKKLFALLALRKKCPAICSLLDFGISDLDLPFPGGVEDGQWSLWRREPKEYIKAFDEWGDDEVENFAREQWWMIAPVFDRYRDDCQDLADETILPFIPTKEHERRSEGIPHTKIGGYSEVTAYRVHPAHHNFWDSSIPLVRSIMITLKSVSDGI
jgi:hypothetical protein